MKENQTSAVLNHLLSGKTLTSMEAFQLFGCTRLSAKVFELRKKGYNIECVEVESTTRYGTLCRYANYFIPREYLKD